MRFLFTALMSAVIWIPTANSAEFVSCTKIKPIKERVLCFDRFAAQQISETESQKADVTKAIDTKAQEELAAASDKALINANVERIKSALTKTLKDPSSAQFKNMVAYGSPNSVIVTFLCGEVNAKNSYGGYIGFRRFFTIGEHTSEIENDKNGYVFDQMWPTTCSGHAVYRQQE